jgi:hypothetical protein
MKRILFLFSLVIVFYSCQKEIISSQDDKENSKQFYEVKLKIGSNFNMTVSNLLASGKSDNSVVSANKYLQYIYCGFYDSIGNLVSFDQQSLADLDFGFISQKLNSGKYTVVLFGEDRSLYTGRYATDSIAYHRFFDFTNLHKFNFWNYGEQDFFKEFELIVNNSDTLLDPIQLDRITGALQIHFTDSIPSNISSISVMIDGNPTVPNLFSAAYGVGQDYRYGSFGQSFYKTELNPINFNCFGSNYKLNVRIFAYDDSIIVSYPKHLVLQKEIDGVYIYANKTTILTGSLFDEHNSSIPIVVDSNYAGSINIKF